MKICKIERKLKVNGAAGSRTKDNRRKNHKTENTVEM